MIEGMIFSAVGGLLATALGGIVGNRADAKVLEAWRVIVNRLRKNDRPINHDLQRAVIRSYLSALITICDESIAELKPKKKEYGKDLLWLENRRTELDQKLKIVEKTEYVTPPLEDLNEIELLLTPEGALARERIEKIKGKLIQASIETENVPSCFKEKIVKSNAGLFELMSLFFAKEIKENEVVRNIFEGQLLAQIDIELKGQRVTVEMIEASLLGVAKEVSEVLNISRRTEEKVDDIAIDVKELLKEKTKKEPPKIPDEIKPLFDTASSLINQGKYEESREVTQKALEIAMTSSNQVAIGRAKYLLAVILQEWDKKPDDAICLLNESLSEFKAADTDSDIANVLFRLGVIEIGEGRLDEAEAFLSQALEIDKRNDDKLRIAQELHQLGWIEDHRGHSKEAFELYDEATKNFLCTFNDIDPEDKKIAAQGIAGCYHHKGLIYESEGRIVDAESNYRKALDWYRTTDFNPDIGKTLYILSKLKYREAEYDAGDVFLDEAIKIFDKIKDYGWHSRCLHLKGQVYFTLGKTNKAIDAFQRAYEMAVTSVDIEQEESLLHTLGNAHLEIKKPDKAKKYFEQAKDLALREGLLESYADAIASLSSIENDKDEKTKLLNEGIRTLEKLLYSMQAEPQRAFIIGKIGSFYEKLGDFKQALIWFQRAKTVYESMSDTCGIANAMGSIARMKGQLGQKPEELDTYRSLKALLAGTPYYDLIAGTAINLGVFYMEQDNLNEAKKSLEEAEHLSKKYNLRYLAHVRDLLEKLIARMDWRRPDEMSYEQLVKELFELVDWFPEAKDSILRLWLWGRKESFFGNLRKNTGIKFMICQDDLTEFQRLSEKLLPYSDLCLQVVSEKKYPIVGMDMIPFPPDKKIFFECAVPFKIDEGGISTVRFASGGIGSRYTLTSSMVKSKITGNPGVVITGMSLGLPEQAHQLLLSSTADDLLSRKVFFLPYDRFSDDDKLETDTNISRELGLIPVYLNTLPASESANILLSKNIQLPVLSPDEIKSLRKQIRNVKRSLLQLLSATHDKVQVSFNDFICDVENLSDDYGGDEFISFCVYILEMTGPLDKPIFTAFVLTR